jgi:hypothetical protein
MDSETTLSKKKPTKLRLRQRRGGHAKKDWRKMAENDRIERLAI